MKPKASSQREYQMKHRLVGAVIMVSAAVLVIPWLLLRQNIEANISRITDDLTASEVAPLSTAGEAAIPAPKNQSDKPVQPALAIKTNTGATPAALLEEVNNDQGAKTSVPAIAFTGWAVRVGTFSKQANADSVSARLAKSGFTARKITVKTALGGDATRIWLGPYAKQATAREVSERLKGLIGEKGFVTKHAP